MRRRETRVADPKNCSSAERNERNERRGVLYASAGNRLPGEWRLPQNFFSFGVFRFFRPSNCRIRADWRFRESENNILVLGRSLRWLPDDG